MLGTLTHGESTVVKKSQCPRCAETGGDRSGDNLATYTDGHSYCYKCHFFDASHKSTRAVLSLKAALEERREATKRLLTLPPDCVSQFPYQPGNWLSSYGITKDECRRDNISWSDKMQGIIFPFYQVSPITNEVSLQAYQVRTFVAGRPKYLTMGPKDDVFWYHSLQHAKTRGIILVEDCLSAIKVGRYACTMPLLGSKLSTSRQLGLFKTSGKLIFWLDGDMADESYKMAQTCAAQGYETKVIVTPEDPKWYEDADIQEILSGVNY